MKRNFKNACIMACSALLAGAVAIAVPNLSSFEANADTDVTFKMTDGAEIRLLADNSTVAGIRFSSEISKLSFLTNTQQQRVIRATASANGGSMVSMNSPVGMLNLV